MDHAARHSLLRAGSVLDHFKIGETLGSGGMGVVFRATDLDLGRDVALKILSERLFASEVARRRFEREARLAASLSHPNVAMIHEIGQHRGLMFIAMELVPGSNLKELLLSGPLPLERALSVGSQSCSALEAAHELGIIHRDVKSSNIMVTPSGSVKVLDFGLAKSGSFDENVDPDAVRDEVARAGEMTAAEATTRGYDTTRGGVALGTPSYMSPEQASGGAVDVRTDIFSLGVVLYEAVCGALPFSGTSEAEILDAIRSSDPTPLQIHRRDAPIELTEVVGKCLYKDPDARYQSASDLREDLVHLASTKRFSGDRSSSKGITPRLAALVGALLVTSILGVVTLVTRTPRGPGPKLLLAGFQNLTEDPFFDDTVTELVGVALQESSRVRIFSRRHQAETLQRMGVPLTTKVDVSIAREICLREGLGAYVHGRVLSAYGGFQLVAQVKQPEEDVSLAVVTVPFASRQEVWEAAESLARQLRAALGDAEASMAAERESGLERVTTSSLEALEHYSRAMRLRAEGELEDAIILMESAVRLDSDFALAHSRLANLLHATGDKVAAMNFAMRAYELRDRTSGREQQLLAAHYHELRGDHDRAIEAYRAATLLYPVDGETFRLLAQAYAAAGELELAVDAARKAASLEPRNLLARGLLPLLLAQSGLFEEALREATAAQGEIRDAPYLKWGEGLARLGLHDYARADDAFEALGAAGGLYESWSALYRGQVSIYAGRWQDATERLEVALLDNQRDPVESNEARLRYWLAQIQLLREDGGSALTHAKVLRQRPLSPAHLDEFRWSSGLFRRLDETGELEGLVSDLEELREQYPSRFTEAALAEARGHLSWRKRELVEAVRHFGYALSLRREPATVWALAELLYVQGDYAGAMDLYEEISAESTGRILRWGFSGWLIGADLQAARCQSRLGASAEAIERYDRFLERWGDEAAGNPLVEAAARERQQLGAPVDAVSSLASYLKKGGNHGILGGSGSGLHRRSVPRGFGGSGEGRQLEAPL